MSQEIEATKLMKALAAERLRNQVRSLKGIYKRIKPNVPTAVLAADCYTENLSLVKNWVNSKSCTIIVPLCVIGDIDILKKSGSKKVSSSNEASRYLETLMRRKTEYIRPQRAGEQTIVWDYAGRIRNSNIVVPKSLREMMSVCLYYKNLISFMPGQEKRNTFFVVTDSTRILNTAEDLGIRGYRPNGWSRFLEKSACAHDNRPCTPNNK